MPRFKSNEIAQLAHQLTLSPRRQRLNQIAGAERLIELIEPDKDYPYDFVCFHLTGYRPLRPSNKPALRGRQLISDLVRVIEHLSQCATLPIAVLSERFHTQEQIAERLNVSMKTISRWRQRGLVGLKLVDDDKVCRLVFSETAVQRFVARNRELVRRGVSFRQLTDAEREHIVTRAAELISSQRYKLQEIARIVADETGRAVETIRYTLRRHDQANPEAALFGPGGRPRVPECYAVVYRAFRAGTAIGDIAREHRLSQRRVEQICNEMRAHELLGRRIIHVYHPEFDRPDAERQILRAAEPSCAKPGSAAATAPADAPAYLRALYHVPLLTREQEQDLFRRYNFCKYRAHSLIQQLEPISTTAAQLNVIDVLLEHADQFQNRIIQANLRLVVSIANRHVRRGDNMFELISDGNMSLLRAVERFDFSRGFKFSTYASWAIMKNYARSIPEQRYRYTRYVTGRDEILESAADRSSATVHSPAEAESVRAAIASGLQHLDQREREILTCHYGLNGGDSLSTLEQLGERFGVTKERIRQIEKRALSKLRQLLSPSLAEYGN